MMREQALVFYGQLGFQTTYHDEHFAIVERDGVDLHLNYYADPPKGHSVYWIAVTNSEVLYQQYLPTNAVQSPLEAKPWGFKEFFVRDPLETSSSLLNTSLKRRLVPNREDDCRRCWTGTHAGRRIPVSLSRNCSDLTSSDILWT
jgi:hypothetical protein